MQNQLPGNGGSNPPPPSTVGGSYSGLVHRVYIVIVKAEVREKGLSE